MGNLLDEICVDCNENLQIDGLRCFNCMIERDYSEVRITELTLDWNN